MKLRTGDKVTVIAGADKGKTGKVLKVLDDKVIVEGVRVVKKHIKPKIKDKRLPNIKALLFIL